MNTDSATAKLRGVGVSPGRVHAPVARMVTGREEPSALPVRVDVDKAAERITVAAAEVAEDLRVRADSCEQAPAQELLRTTAQIAQDPTLVKEAQRLTRQQRLTPERAVWDSAGAVTEQFASLGGYFAERVPDVCDVRDRIIAKLTGDPMPGVPRRREPFVLVATDLSPADTAALDPASVHALLTAEGGPTSHTAILARALGIPAVVGLDEQLDRLTDGDMVLVDGGSGLVCIDPDEQTVAQALRPVTQRRYEGHCVTTDGQRIELLANIGDPAAAAEAAEAGAEGVGLFRTEFCFLERQDEPDHDEQVSAYRQVLASFAGKKVVVRTLDAGADKSLLFLNPEVETNPALGVRGYRTAAAHPEVLDRQLAAIAEAARAEDARVWVMAPMISTVAEAEEFVARASGHGLETAGVMVEVPSAALLAGRILARAHFASIGTNDLTQYTLAADRLLGSLSKMASTWDPAVLALVHATCTGAQAQDRPVTVCGEAAADPALAAVLVGLGVRSLSMTPRALGDVAAVLGALSMTQCAQVAALALAAESARDARLRIREQLPVLDELGL
ncbi:phosphoenolpyruvate--protein phosphotransferase [Pseudactinotalea sp. Z1739]|uniref:phosphoenolpyruvate--protein phosphotransferase n=1 Tax=Pseudactinotalea sp. Z1739 TaxID=3413028 RepID=UPI003C7CB6DE